MKRILTVLTCITAAFALCFCLAACGSSESSDSNSSSGSSSSSSEEASSDSSSTTVITNVSEDNKYASGTHHAVVEVDGYGSFTIELDADAAPVTVANFCHLAEDGFYDGLTFHRVVEGFCLQGGDPLGTGTGGSDQNILGEFSGNDVDNALADDFGRGTVAMARSSEADSASSQFFITLDSSDSVSQSLNGQYAAFGTVDKKGMKVVDKIVKGCAGDADASSGTISDSSAQPKISSITITD